MKLSIYCAKSNHAIDNPYMLFNDCNSIQELINKGFVDLSITSQENGRANNVEGNFFYKLFLKENHPKNPKRRSFIFDGIIGDARRINPFTKSCSGIILLKQRVKENPNEYKLFIITFGSGHSYIDESMILENFGLKTVLNCIDIQHIHMIDKKNISGNARQVKEGFADPTNVKNFDIDKMVDNLTFVEGCPTTDQQTSLGKKLGGRDSLIVDLPITFNQLGAFCRNYYLEFIKTTYQDNGFDFIDNFSTKIDKEIIDELNILLREAVQNNEDSLRLCPKDIIQSIEQIEQFEVFVGPSHQMFTDLNHTEIIDFINSTRIHNFDDLNAKCKIQGQDAEGNAVTNKTPFLKYLVFETNYNNTPYLLHEGKRYVINTDYFQRVNDDITYLQTHNVLSNTGYLRFDPATHIDANGKSSEGSYNSAQGDEQNFHCIDKGLFHGYSSSIEVGDLLYSHAGEHHLIHIKKYKGSATLSHLFAQCKISYESLREHTDYFNFFLSSFRVGFPGVPAPRQDQIINVLGIIRKENDLDKLPFFSKVNLLGTIKLVKKNGGDIKIIFIPIQ